MTDQTSKVLKQLAAVSDRPTVASIQRWLACDATYPLSEKPHEVSVAELRDLWRVRVEISSSKGHRLAGGTELLEVLTVLDARVKLQQIGFSDSKQMGNIFFKKHGGQYVGSILF